MQKVRNAKKILHPIRVGINPLNVKRINRGFSYEREIKGFEIPLTQKVLFEPSQKQSGATLPAFLSLKVFGTGEKPVSMLSIPIETYHTKGSNKTEKVATLFWAQTQKEYQKKGLASHLITEAVHTLKKMRVQRIEASVLDTHAKSALKRLGFKLVSKKPNWEEYVLTRK